MAPGEIEEKICTNPENPVSNLGLDEYLRSNIKWNKMQVVRCYLPPPSHAQWGVPLIAPNCFSLLPNRNY